MRISATPPPPLRDHAAKRCSRFAPLLPGTHPAPRSYPEHSQFFAQFIATHDNQRESGIAAIRDPEGFHITIRGTRRARASAHVPALTALELGHLDCAGGGGRQPAEPSPVLLCAAPRWSGLLADRPHLLNPQTYLQREDSWRPRVDAEHPDGSASCLPRTLSPLIAVYR